MSSLGDRPLASLIALVTTLLPKMTNKQALKYRSQRRVSRDDDDDDDDTKLKSFCNYDLVSPNSQYIETLVLTIQTKLGKFDRLKIIIILYLLSNPIGTFLLFANIWMILKPFTKWDQQARIIGLQNLRDSNLLFKRAIFSGFKRLLCGLAFTFTIEELKDNVLLDSKSTSSPDELNPFWQAVQYPGPLHHHLPPEKDKELRESSGHDLFYKDGEKNPNVFIDPSKVSQLEYDVIIIGTGAGGSVAAFNLASAGHTVLMIEKGEYVPPDKVSNIEAEAMDKMYEKHGLMTTEDGNITILAGSTLGGGTSINWGCCIDTPQFVREEWCNVFGLEQFRPTNTTLDDLNEFDASLHFIKKRIGCDDSISTSRSVSESNESAVAKGKDPPHNAANTLFWDACRKMEYKVEETGCNMKYPGDDAAGYSPLGDRYGNKQSGTVTFISDAIKTGNLKILEKCAVLRILMKTSLDGKKKAVGVEVKTMSGIKPFQIKAGKCVVCSAGSLHTPCILLRSKLKNKHIGQHLHLHPVLGIVGFYYGVEASQGHEALNKLLKPVRPSKDKGLVQACLRAPMTVVCKEFEKVHNGYGCKLEVPSLHLGLAAAALSWLDPFDFRSKLLQYSNTLPLCVLQRDNGEGTVTLDYHGLPSVSYSLSDQDKESMMQGTHGALKILLSAGCDVITTCHYNDYGLELELEQAEVKESKDLLKKNKVKSYFSKVQERGIEKHRIGIFSAHQMGSCRMGIDRKDSVIDTNGQTWDCDDLYVMDASSFPSASGANPMLTTYTISHMLSNRLVKKLNSV